MLHYLFGKQKEEYYLLKYRYLEEVIMGNELETSELL